MAMTYVPILCKHKREQKLSWFNGHSSLKNIYAKLPCYVFIFASHHVHHFIRRVRSNDFIILLILSIKQTDAQSTAQGGAYAWNIPHILRLIIEWI